MLVGDANQRTKIGSGRKSQSCFRCYSGPNFKGDDAAPCADAKLDTETLPSGPCSGIRSNILYPTYVTRKPSSCQNTSTYKTPQLLGWQEP